VIGCRQADVVGAFLRGEPEGFGKPVGVMSTGTELWVHGRKVATWEGKVVIVSSVRGVLEHKRSIMKVVSLIRAMAGTGVSVMNGGH
jgi:hypothetical protein